MTTVTRYEGLKKFPNLPAAQVLARGRAKLGTPLDPQASVPAALAALERQKAAIDALKLIAHALPPREATWWACLAARDLMAPDAGEPPASLAAAEAWVFRPGDETRANAREAMEKAPPEDDTTLCAMAAVFSDGTLGPGQLSDYAAPPGAVGAAVHGMVLLSYGADPERMEERFSLLIERGLDIARGGNGRVEAPDTGAAAAQGA